MLGDIIRRYQAFRKLSNASIVIAQSVRIVAWGGQKLAAGAAMGAKKPGWLW